VTERHAAYIVTLEKSLDEEDAREILRAIELIRGVVSAKPVESNAYLEHVAQERADQEWRERLYDLVVRSRS
jgi:hypothetical protein